MATTHFPRRGIRVAHRFPIDSAVRQRLVSAAPEQRLSHSGGMLCVPSHRAPAPTQLCTADVAAQFPNRGTRAVYQVPTDYAVRPRPNSALLHYSRAHEMLLSEGRVERAHTTVLLETPRSTLLLTPRAQPRQPCSPPLDEADPPPALPTQQVRAITCVPSSALVSVNSLLPRDPLQKTAAGRKRRPMTAPVTRGLVSTWLPSPPAPAAAAIYA